MIPGTVGIVLFPSGGITNCFSILKKFRVRDCSAKKPGSAHSTPRDFSSPIPFDITMGT